MTAFACPEYLVEPTWLADRLDDPSVVVLDVTAKLTSKLENRAEDDVFGPAHIPGSIFFDVASARGRLSNQGESLPWMWPTVSEFEATMADVGVGPDTHVVVTAQTPRPGIDSGTMWCTRAWWTMHHMGVTVSILNGGIERWQAEGHPLTDDAGAQVPPSSSRFQASSDGAAGRASQSDVLAALADGSGACVVDALSEADFAGEGPAYGPRTGHITGASNLPGRSLVDAETARFPDAGELHRRLDAAGLFDGREIVTYCGGAIVATVPAFALALFGIDGVKVYDGSLMEWAADDDLPMSSAPSH